MKRTEPRVSSFLFIFLSLMALWIFPFLYMQIQGRKSDMDGSERLLTLQVSYPDYKPGYILSRDLMAFTDEGLSNPLFLRSVSFDDHQTYRFQYSYTKLPDTLYLVRPVLFVPIYPDEENPLTVELGASDKSVSYKDRELFHVSSIETLSPAAGVFHISVTCEPTADAVPTEATLEAGGFRMKSRGDSGTFLYTFQADGSYQPVTLHFLYNIGARDTITDLLAHAVLYVEEASLRTDELDCNITSEISGLELVILNENQPPH